MRKYGIEHFHIELIEETDNPNERERFWIEEKGSFKNGYNATVGGDGRPFLDYDVLIAAYLELKNVNKTAKKFNCCPYHLRKILKSRNIEIIDSKSVIKENMGKCVNQYTLKGEYVNTFATAREAARALSPEIKKNNLGGAASHITDVCKGKRKTAYGFIWKFSNNL